MTPSEFNEKYITDPEQKHSPFRSDLTVNWVGDPSTLATPVQTTNSIDADYCATDECAADLATIIQAANIGSVEIYQDFPQRGWPADNQFEQSAKVPWIRVTDASGNVSEQNAGQMARFFTHNYPPDTAADWMVNQFRMDLKAAQEAKDRA